VLVSAAAQTRLPRVPLLIPKPKVSDVMSPSRARRGCESTTLQLSNEAPLHLRVCVCVSGFSPPPSFPGCGRDVPMKTVASLHGPAFALR
jgi:hypothetical protein